ncbi:MAG TPA: hypothetical protein VGG65_09475 [Thermoanaerobaculia bacterium]|jgi:hypothetical protein
MRRCWRRIPALYLLALFAAAAAAPHHHLDPIADLLSDGPSNSGTFAQIAGPGSLGQGLYAGALVQDESCFACFHSDFVGSPAVALVLTQALQRLPDRPVALAPTVLARPASGTSSRAPPVFA